MTNLEKVISTLMNLESIFATTEFKKILMTKFCPSDFGVNNKLDICKYNCEECWNKEEDDNIHNKGYSKDYKIIKDELEVGPDWKKAAYNANFAIGKYVKRISYEQEPLIPDSE